MSDLEKKKLDDFKENFIVKLTYKDETKTGGKRKYKLTRKIIRKYKTNKKIIYKKKRTLKKKKRTLKKRIFSK